MKQRQMSTGANVNTENYFIEIEKPVSEVQCLEPVSLREPLRSENHVRLLLLYPPALVGREEVASSPLEDVPLRCEVFQASLDNLKATDKPAFAAISYRWGDTVTTRTAYCGDICVKIHANLYGALRRALFHNQARLIWTDALCIDQNNAAEKSSQVARMSDIYRNAHVIIDLGHSDDLDADAKMIACFALFAGVYAALQERSTPGSLYEIPDARLQRLLTIEAKKFGFDRLEDLPWLKMRAFFTNPYFGRTWIIQEITWAWSHEVHFGIWLIPLDHLRQSAEVLTRFFEIARPLIHESTTSLNRRTAFSRSAEYAASFLLVGHVYQDENGATKSTLIHSPRELMDIYSASECSDPRDHIYAMASMFPSELQPEPYPINYLLTAAEVFTDFALDSLRAHNDLVLLSSCARQSFWSNPHALIAESHRSWVPCLPSWCPDWSGVSKAARELVHFTRVTSIVWRPAGDSLAAFTSMSRTVLGVKGLSIDTVQSCSIACNLQDDHDRCLPQVFQSMEDFMLKLLGIVHIETLWRLFLDVLLAPNKQDGADIVEELYTDTSDRSTYGEILRDVGPVWLQLCAPKMYRRAKCQKRRHTQKRLNQVKKLSYIMVGRSWNARLILTANGLVGTAPEGSKPGDEVCALYGGKALYILRPHKDGVHYTLIGEAYVFGLMDGDALDLDLPEREFRLV